MIITLFRNIKETTTPYHLNVEDILKRIKKGTSKKKILQIRNEKDKVKRNELKKQLPSICFSGQFRERSAKKIIAHSGLICLDFDDFKDEEEMLSYKNSFCKDEFTYACFISPSGNGLKLLVKIPKETFNHKKYFESLQDYYNTPHFDISGSDVSRVCYESYDKDLYINEDSEIFDTILDTKEYEYHNTEQVKVPLKDETEIVRRLDKWWSKNYGFVLGERNSNIFKLACAFSEFGIKQYSCERHLSQYAEDGFSLTEIQRTIQSAYKKTKHSFDTKYFEDSQISEYVNRQYLSGISEEKLKKELLNKKYEEEDIAVLIEEAKSNETIDIFWSISSKGKVTIISKKLKDYLRQRGFYKYYPEGSKNFVFVRVEANLIDFTTDEKIKAFIMNELEENENYEVYEYLAVNTRFFKEDYLNILDPIKVSLKQDTKDTAYCYFKNCVVEVTPKKINTVEYLDLDGYVWKDRVINRTFKKVRNTENDFQRFVTNIAGNNEKNILSFETTLGYLSHSYKNKGYSPAVILNDEVISENPEGGTGKGLIVTALSNLKKATILDGKAFDKNKSFPYQVVTTSTQILVFDDVKKKFDFEGLFSLITEGITLEKKNKDAIKLDFYQSPKVLITTNYAINGKGNSNDRRKWELELAQYYTIKHTPLDDFGKLLFDDWKDDEWLAFDNYMMDNIQKFIKNGFESPEFKNLKTRKFINATSFEFHEWAEDEGNDLIKKSRVSKSELYENFIEDYSDYKKWLRKKTFRNWLEELAKFKGQEFKEGNSNGIRWCDLGFKNVELELEEIEF